MVLGFDFDRLRSGPFEGPAIVKPPALPGDTYFHSDSMEASSGNASWPPQVVSFEGLPMSQVVQQGALTKLVVEKGIFTKEEFLKRGRVVDQEMKGKKKIIE